MDRALQRIIQSDIVLSGKKVHFVERARPTQGWSQVYIRREYTEPTIDLRKWATEMLTAMHEQVLPVLQQAQVENKI